MAGNRYQCDLGTGSRVILRYDGDGVMEGKRLLPRAWGFAVSFVICCRQVSHTDVACDLFVRRLLVWLEHVFKTNLLRENDAGKAALLTLKGANKSPSKSGVGLLRM